MKILAFPFNPVTGFTPELQADLIHRIQVFLSDYEFQSFLLGIAWPKKTLEPIREKLKTEFQFPFIQELEKVLHRPANFQSYDVELQIDFNAPHIQFGFRSVYVYGRYQKLARNIAQTVPYCYMCKGHGCRHCNFSGRKNLECVEELIGEIVTEFIPASEYQFHGEGREDSDVRMFGNGRAFVLELRDPKKRTCDLAHLQEKINTTHAGKIHVTDIQFTTKEKIAQVKNTDHEKIYRALVVCLKPHNLTLLNPLLHQLLSIQQFTPTRVSERRALLNRIRFVHLLKIEPIDDRQFYLELKTSAGLYVKEFISGDQEKTKPSISSLLKNDCECVELDVLEIVER